MAEITRRGLVKGAALAPLALPFRSAAQPAADPEHFDMVVAGAGHNSLVCSAYLAKAGYKVLVLEGRPTIGGGCKTAEVCLPGFKEDLCSSVHGGLQANPLLRNNELNLRDYGLEYIDPDPVMHIPFVDGASITVWRDLDRTCETIARFSKKDAETFRRLVPEFKANAQNGAADRGAGRRLPGVWQRLSAMSGYDAVRTLFESGHMRAACLSCGHFGGVPGGDFGTGNQAFSLMGQVLSGRPIAKGGSGMLSVALGRFIEAHNGVILTNKPVARLVIENGKCTGVDCVDGSRYRAGKAVVSTIHVKHLVNMAPRELWGEEFTRNLEVFQPEHAMFSFHFATSDPPRYPLPGGGTISTVEASLMEHPESILLLNSFNARGEVNVEDIPLQIVSPSVGDPSRAPVGHHTVKIEGTMPYALKEGPQHWDNIKDQVAEKIFGRLRRVSPNLTPDKILAKFLESPLDIERMNPAMWRGSAHHGDRRLPQFVSYKMPIPGLYQTGACTAPGGSITGMPGRNAAAALLKDLGTSIEDVVNKTVSEKGG
ncbi:MAG TPA: NAD(P)/FAD-dependent oxidoreductase [Bryobacteraceae bacterium]|nr:NAD(P)/FAD-dependent oxidoreductase [Bryobacteraceae bacterium]